MSVLFVTNNLLERLTLDRFVSFFLLPLLLSGASASFAQVTTSRELPSADDFGVNFRSRVQRGLNQESANDSSASWYQRCTKNPYQALAIYWHDNSKVEDRKLLFLDATDSKASQVYLIEIATDEKSIVFQTVQPPQPTPEGHRWDHRPLDESVAAVGELFKKIFEMLDANNFPAKGGSNLKVFVGEKSLSLTIRQKNDWYLVNSQRPSERFILEVLGVRPDLIRELHKILVELEPARPLKAVYCGNRGILFQHVDNNCLFFCDDGPLKKMLSDLELLESNQLQFSLNELQLPTSIAGTPPYTVAMLRAVVQSTLSMTRQIPQDPLIPLLSKKVNDATSNTASK